MPGSLCTTASTAICAHGGQAQATAPAVRVRAAGSPAVLATAPWTIAGCPFPPNSGGPCVTAMWSTSTVRVRSSGQPLVISTGSATCAPTGVPLTVLVAQPRVRAT